MIDPLQQIFVNIERMNTRIGRGAHARLERSGGERCELHPRSSILVVDIELGEHAYVLIRVCSRCLSTADTLEGL